ncbi:MAG: hypothetical protein ACRBBN_01750 [Methyloligellaceae bacterium]
MITILKATLIGGLIAATLDIIWAISIAYLAKKMPPQKLLQFVASGLLGVKAYARGWSSAALGLLSHYIIALVMAFAFVVVARQIPVILVYPLIAGAAYGVFLFFVMNWIVVPRSGTVPKLPLKGPRLVMEIIAHIVLVGMPIALIAACFIK